MILEQLPDQDYKDGLAFRRMREDSDTWGALERLVKRMSDDTIRKWTDDTTGQLSKKWLKGARDMCEAFIPVMVQMIADSESAIEETKDLEKTARSRADDGLGSGDIAIA